MTRRVHVHWPRIFACTYVGSSQAVCTSCSAVCFSHFWSLDPVQASSLLCVLQSVWKQQLLDCRKQTLFGFFCFLFFLQLCTYILTFKCAVGRFFFLADYQKKFGEDYGSCQAGISNFLTEVSGADLFVPAVEWNLKPEILEMCFQKLKIFHSKNNENTPEVSFYSIEPLTETVIRPCLHQDLIIMGAPGTSYWTGSVLVFNTSSGGMSVYLDDETGAVSFGSYLGKWRSTNTVYNIDPRPLVNLSLLERFKWKLHQTHQMWK